MTLPHLPSIHEIEGYTTQLFAFILLLISGFRLVLQELQALKRKKRAPRQRPTHDRACRFGKPA